MSDSPRPRRVPKTVTVARTESITRDLVRVHFSGAELEPLAYTDHYVKILFPPAGADYRWPFDPEELRETLPREQWPVTRTYTIRSYDPARGELAIDFVVHGDAGLAGPWAATVQPRESIGFLGPGGGWRPNPDADVHLLVGDESALPAIAAALEQLPDGARALVFAEVADASAHVPLRVRPGVEVQWVHRDEVAAADSNANGAGHGSAYGRGLVSAVRAADWPDGVVEVFVHGNADMIRDLRRYLFLERQVPRERASISGYWRSGQNEDAWQAGKRDFNAQMERDEADRAAPQSLR